MKEALTAYFTIGVVMAVAYLVLTGIAYKTMSESEDRTDESWKIVSMLKERPIVQAFRVIYVIILWPLDLIVSAGQLIYLFKKRK